MLELSGEDTESLCQAIIIPLHRDRILGRLGSEKTQGQKWSQVCMLERVRSLSRMVRSVMPRLGKSHQQLQGHVDDLQKCISYVFTYTPHSTEEHAALKELLRAAFNMNTAADTSFVRLQKAGIQTVSEQSREIREISALGNYYRIGRDFAQVARQYRRWFTTIELNVIEAHRPKKRRGLEQFVHAEIQLLNYFE